MSKKILVLQFRTDESTEHEQKCFYDEYSDYDLDLDFKNIVQEDVPTSVVDEYRGIILGGSGEFYLAQGDDQKDWLQQTYNLLDKAFDNSVHVLGICLGAQIIALHQGSNITDDTKYHETGSYQISLSDNADKCDIFSDLDKEFHAPLCHEDTPINIPENLTKLASSEKVNCQAYKIENKPAWGVLFHPELNRERLKYRFKLYPNYIDNDKEVLDEKISDFNKDRRSSKVLHKFYDIIPV